MSREGATRLTRIPPSLKRIRHEKRDLTPSPACLASTTRSSSVHSGNLKPAWRQRSASRCHLVRRVTCLLMYRLSFNPLRQFPILWMTPSSYQRKPVVKSRSRKLRRPNPKTRRNPRCLREKYLRRAKRPRTRKRVDLRRRRKLGLRKRRANQKKRKQRRNPPL